MSELDFEVEKTSFVVSVIDAIEEYVKVYKSRIFI